VATNKITTKIELTADDKATPKVKDVKTEVDKVDGKKAVVKVEADTKAFTDGVEGLNDGLDQAINKVQDIKGRGAAGGVLAVGAALLAAGEHAADLAIEVGNLKALTGDTAEESSRLNGVWKGAGFDAKDLQDVLLQMNGVLSTNGDMAKQLGINLNDGKTVGQRFEQVVAALGENFTDAGERSQLASQLFGEEGVRQVNAVTEAYGDLSTAVDEYTGKVFSDEEIRKAREYKAQLREVKTEFEQLTVKAGGFTLGFIGGLETAGTAIGKFFRGLTVEGDVFESWGIERAFDASVEAANGFDRALLDSAKTIEEVRQIATQYGLDLHGVNMIAVEWSKTHQEAVPVLTEFDDRVEGVARAMDDAAAAILREREAAKKNLDATKDLTEEYKDQRDELDDLLRAKTQLVGGEIAVRQSQRDAKTAMDELNTSIADGTLAYEDLGPALDDVVTQQMDAAQTAADYEAAQLRANGSTVDAQTEMFLYKQELQKLADQATGPTRDALLALIAQLDEVARDRTATVNIQVLQNGQRVNLGGGAAIGGGIIQDGPDTGARATSTSAPVASGASFGGSSAGTAKELIAPVTNIYNAVSVNAIDPGTFMYDLDRMAKGLG